MGILDELKKLAMPVDDGADDFYEGADTSSAAPRKPVEEHSYASQAQLAFENTFADTSRFSEQQARVQAQAQQAQAQQAQTENTSIFGNLGAKKTPRPKASPRGGMMNFGGRDTQVILFAPKSFDEAGELVNYMMQNLTVVMTLESVQGDMVRRLLDFISGIAFALQGKITPVSAKTYFITPQNVDILGTQPDQPESSGNYL